MGEQQAALQHDAPRTRSFMPLTHSVERLLLLLLLQAMVWSAASTRMSSSTFRSYGRTLGRHIFLRAHTHRVPAPPSVCAHSALLNATLTPLLLCHSVCVCCCSTFGGSRYWTMVASPVPDMEGGREQSVWFRFQQIVCKGEEKGPPYTPIPPCSLHGAPQYYDTYTFVDSGSHTRTQCPHRPSVRVCTQHSQCH